MQVMEMVEMIPVTRAHALEKKGNIPHADTAETGCNKRSAAGYGADVFLVYQLGDISGISGALSGLYRMPCGQRKNLRLEKWLCIRHTFLPS